MRIFNVHKDVVVLEQNEKRLPEMPVQPKPKKNGKSTKIEEKEETKTEE